MLLCQFIGYSQTAQALPARDSEFLTLNEYYTIDESQTKQESTDSSLGGLEVGPLAFARYVRNLALNLLRWTLHPEAPQAPQDRYNRRAHFGRWINDPTDETCYNTRAKVLLRDTDAPVSYKESNRCVVEKGSWPDPYSGRVFTESREIQIDHMVPLKDAYLSGAWEWNFQTRCLYANFMGNKFHLVASNGIENMRKGDRAPDKYMPPNQAHRCQYLENWLKIKLIWQLKMTPNEVTAIREGIEENGCNPRNFSLSKQELKQQRTYIRQNLGLCPDRK